MTDQLLDRFGRLNPVPDPDRHIDLGEPALPSHPVLRAVLERADADDGRPATAPPPPDSQETPMRTLAPDRSDEDHRGAPRSPKRGWLIAAAAAAVAVVALAGVVTLVGNEPGEDVIAPPPDADPQSSAAEALATAEAYIDAHNAFDSERARELVADNFTTTEEPDGFRNVATMELAFELHAAYGFHYSDGECDDPTVGAQPARVTVSCDYLWTTELQRITGYPPVPVSFWFVVRDGLITRIGHDSNRNEFMPNVYSPWIDDFLGDHRGFRQLVEATHGLHPERTRQAIEQMPRYLELYEEWHNSRDE